MRGRLAALALAAFVLGCGHLEARPGHGGNSPIAAACPGTVPVGQDDGCASANKSAQFINTAFFTNARQSGQSAYAATPSWNIAGVTYPVGQITPDAGLIDFATSPPSGWSVLVANKLYQNSSAATVSGYFLNDVGIFKSAGNLTFTNNHVRLGVNSCRAFAGTAPVNVQSSSAFLDAENNTFDTDSTCSWQAELYGTSVDPGLTQQSSENITIASNVLTVNSGGTGLLAEGQFLNWSGRGQQVRISTNISPGGISNCSGAACNGTTWNVCQFISTSNSGACTSTVTDVGPVAATTGPIQPNANAALRLANTNGTNNYTVKYNYINGYSTMAASGGGGTNDHRFNYVVMTGHSGDHDNLVANLIEPGTATTIPYYQKFNTVVWLKNSPNTGTTLLGTFLATNNTNKVGGYQMTWDPFDISYNTVVTNSTTYPVSGPVTASMWRALQQGTATTTICNSSGTCSGSSISGNQLVVASVVSGASLQVGDAIDCNSCNWTGAVRIQSIDTGTGGAGNYTLNRTVGSFSSLTSMSAFRYNGIVLNQIGQNNYFDATGAGTNFIFDTKNDVGVCSMSGNINMLTGATITSPCP